MLRIRDPIHGIIEYSEIEEKVINTWLIQRLRGIRQLAFAELVYPGARHSRFEHSIGTMHIAGRLAHAAKLPKQNTEIVRLAALLHDVGHGPFSHVSEHCLETYSDPKYLNGPHQIHEKLTAKLILQDKELQKILGKSTLEDIAKIIIHGGSRSVMNDIVSGPLDADKLDYLLRDNYYAGVKYGVYDLDRIVSEAVSIGEEQESLGFRSGAIWAIEQLLLAKHHMLTQVYSHRIRLITDAMIVRGIELAAEDDDNIRKLFAYDESENFLEQWKDLDDNKLFLFIENSKSERARRLFSRLKRRELYKCGLSIDLIKDVENFFIRDKLSKLEGNKKKDAEKHISELLENVRPWEVIINVRSFSKPTIKGSKIQIDPDTILILDENGRLEHLSNRTEVIDARSEKRQYLDIYFPVPIPDREKRKQYIYSIKEQLKECLFKSV